LRTLRRWLVSWLMSDVKERPSDLFLTPHGLLMMESDPVASSWADVEAAQRVAAAFAESTACGLLHLGSRELNSVLPPAAAWWREVAVLPPPVEMELAVLIESAPPMRGKSQDSVAMPPGRKPGKKPASKRRLPKRSKQ
jgi:hypothetical protein